MTRNTSALAALGMAALATGCISVDSYEQAPPRLPPAGPVRFDNPASVAAPVGAYSHAAIVPQGAELIAIAGQVGLALDGSLPPTAEAQFEQALSNVLRIVESQGGSARDIVKINMYMVQGERGLDYDKLRSAAPFWARPARLRPWSMFRAWRGRNTWWKLKAWAVKRAR